jgi:hypothetical protein
VGIFSNKGFMKMVISPVTHPNVTVVAPHVAVAPVNKEATQSKPQPTATDTVQICSAGKVMQAAVQEAIETPRQTAKEAASGDPQAQRLLARAAAAAEEAKESPAAKAQEAQEAQQVKA